MLFPRAKAGHHLKATLVWLFIGLLIITNLVIGSLYWLEREDDQAAPFSSQEDTAQQAVESAEESPLELQEPLEAPTVYTSKAARFSLNLNPKYRIMVEREKDGEQTSTVLRIGRKSPTGEAVVNANENDYVKIEAFSSDLNGSRDEFVTADTAIQGNSADEMSVMIDGVSARKFTLDGVGSTIKYFFENEDMTYHIEAWDISTGDTESMMREVVKGFSFN